MLDAATASGRPGADATVETPMVGTPRWQLWVAAILLLGHAVLAWLTRSFTVTTHDEANYILLARELRHFRYVDAFLVGAPAHAHYPPAYPAFLALLSLPFGEHLDLYIAANIAASVMTLVLLYDVLRRRLDGGTALAALAVGALNPSLVQFAGMPLTETPYMFLSAVTLWVVLREPPAETGAPSGAWLWPVLAGISAICAALTRSAGVTILAALFVYWILERRYRRAAILFVAGTLTVGSWLAWVVVAPGKTVGRSYAADLAFTPGHVGLARTMVRRVVQNVSHYPTTGIPSVLPQPSVPGTKIDNVIGLLVLAVVVGAGAAILWKRARVTVIYLAAYAALLAVWPWNEDRLLVPALPVLLCLIMAGAFRVGRMARWLRPTPILIAGAIAVTAVVEDWSETRLGLECDRANATTSEACFSIDKIGFFAATRFIRASTPPDAVVMTPEDALMGYHADRRTLFAGDVNAATSSALLSELREHGTRYVLLSPRRSPRTLRVDLWREQCADLTLVKEFPATTLLLYLPPVSGAPPVPNACADIDRYQRSPTNAAMWPNGAGDEK